MQAKDEQLRKLRAAEESALPAAEDDDLAASYEGHLLLTVQGGKEMKLKPEQVGSFGCLAAHIHMIRSLTKSSSSS